jgi:hypothetical protein
VSAATKDLLEASDELPAQNFQAAPRPTHRLPGADANEQRAEDHPPQTA